uniref:Uncharacterized protein n=1 Tax=Cacopsylla melanoneura TaxID=428564 RepID=A0A8D8M0S4_9HEMI
MTAEGQHGRYDPVCGRLAVDRRRGGSGQGRRGWGVFYTGHGTAHGNFLAHIRHGGFHPTNPGLIVSQQVNGLLYNYSFGYIVQVLAEEGQSFLDISSHAGGRGFKFTANVMKVSITTVDVFTRGERDDSRVTDICIRGPANCPLSKRMFHPSTLFQFQHPEL